MSQSTLQMVNNYHQQTKHRPGAYARSAGYMDWANQPLPYRLYEGTEKIYLPLNQEVASSPIEYIFQVSPASPAPISVSSIASLLQNSLGLSAWKSYNGTEWALRINPSSGNLHPTECYLLLPESQELPELQEMTELSDSQELKKKTVHSLHYNPYINCLEKRARLADVKADFLQDTTGFAIVLTSIAWREAWKYGERAYRYCQHDLGHALAALNIAANLNGWKIEVLDELSNSAISALLGLNQSPHAAQETEYVDCVCWVSAQPSDLQKVKEWINALSDFDYMHQSNQLSHSHQEWPVIEDVFKASHQQNISFIKEDPATLSSPVLNPDVAILNANVATVNSNLTASNKSSESVEQSAEHLILQRRSAQSFDREASFISSELFLKQLHNTLPTQSVPFSVLPQTAQVHLLLFVHHVQGLDAGLYIWVRNPMHLQDLKSAMKPEFLWQPCFIEEPLYVLKKGDFRRIAKALSCEQNIAADGAYSLGMLARFETSLSHSASQYPLLFWETGLIGQVLYLAAEREGLRGTGIGCFFDDQVHDLVGLKDQQWQSLYHFTVGKAIDDKRISTKPAYFHLQAKADGESYSSK